MLFQKICISPPKFTGIHLNSERYLILSIYILQMINWINKQQKISALLKNKQSPPQPPKRRVEPTVSPSGRRWWHWRKSPHPSHSRDRRVQGLGSIPEDSSWRKPWNHAATGPESYRAFGRTLEGILFGENGAKMTNGRWCWFKWLLDVGWRLIAFMLGDSLNI